MPGRRRLKYQKREGHNRKAFLGALTLRHHSLLLCQPLGLACLGLILLNKKNVHRLLILSIILSRCTTNLPQLRESEGYTNLYTSRRHIHFLWPVSFPSPPSFSFVSLLSWIRKVEVQAIQWIGYSLSFGWWLKVTEENNGDWRRKAGFG